MRNSWSPSKRFPACCAVRRFGNQNALRLIERYRDAPAPSTTTSRGTGAVALTGKILSALRITGGKLRDHRVLSSAQARAGHGHRRQHRQCPRRRRAYAREARKHCWFGTRKVSCQKDATSSMNTSCTLPMNMFPALTDFAVKTASPPCLIG